MKYEIKQKIFSFGDNFTIKNQHDEDQYIVEGKVFSIGDKLKIKDLEGNELLYIEQEIFRFLPEYNIYRGETHLANVKKEFAFFRHEFTIDSEVGDYTLEGDFFGHDFQLLRDGEVIANINKEWFSFSDTYIAEIDDKVDQAFTLALVIVVDQVIHDNKNKGNAMN